MEGTTTGGEMAHTPGPPEVQLNVTFALYPFSAVSVPFQITASGLGPVTFGLAVSAMVKFSALLPLPTTPPHESSAINPSARLVTAIPM